jgi:uncharacterized membrane protein YccC
MVALYLATMAAYIYAFEHRPDADHAREKGLDEALVLAVAALVHVALGAVVGGWRALVVLLVPIVIAIPAGGYPGGWPEFPLAVAIGFQLLVYGVPLVALGLLLGWLVHRYARTA